MSIQLPVSASSRRAAPNRVREFRKAAGLSQADLARALGITVPVVSELETRRNGAIGRDTWIRLSELLDVDMRILARPA